MMMATVMVVAKYRCNTTTRPTCCYICIKKKENCGRSAVPERAEERDAERRAQNAAAIRESKMNRRNSFYSYYYVYKSFASFANASSFALSAPHISFTITPLEYSWNVGIALIPQAAATSSNSSTSTLTNSTSGNLVASSSKYGPIALHGPHHVAVKSTRSCCFWRRRFQREREILLLQRTDHHQRSHRWGKNPISKMDALEERVCILSQRPPKTTQPGVVVLFEAKKERKERKGFRTGLLAFFNALNSSADSTCFTICL